MSTKEEALARVNRKAAVVQRVLATADGQALLEILEDEFLLNARRETQFGAAFNLGSVDVIGYIKQLNRHGR